MIPLKITRTCECEVSGKLPIEYVRVPGGTVVDYKGHIPGGMIVFEYEGKRLIVHPANTDCN